eukprot:1550096-Rhodomonas_salina.1
MSTTNAPEKAFIALPSTSEVWFLNTPPVTSTLALPLMASPPPYTLALFSAQSSPPVATNAPPLARTHPPLERASFWTAATGPFRRTVAALNQTPPPSEPAKLSRISTTPAACSCELTAYTAPPFHALFPRIDALARNTFALLSHRQPPCPPAWFSSIRSSPPAWKSVLVAWSTAPCTAALRRKVAPVGRRTMLLRPVT